MLNTIKHKLRKLLPHLAYFYQHLRYRMFVLIITSIFVGLLDGLGLTMFLPLLELVADADATASSSKLGNLSFIMDGLEAIGLQLTLNVVMVTMLIFFAFKGVATFFERYMRVVYQQYFIAKIRIDNIQALSNYNYKAFVSADAGAIQNTMSGEVERVLQAFRSYSDILQKLVMIMTYMALAFLASPKFAMLIAVGGILSNFLFTALYRKTKSLSTELVGRNHSFQGYVIQGVAFFKYLKATSYIYKYADFLKHKVVDIEVTNRKMGILNSIMMGLREPIMIGIVVGVIMIQVNLLGGVLGTIILSLLFFYRGLNSLTSLQTSYNKFLSFSGSLDNMSSFVKDLLKNQNPNGHIHFDSFKTKIDLIKVGFTYNVGEPILQNVNLSIKKNESIAFIGESGSGKTTLLNLIAGLLSPTEGQYSIDGTGLEKLDMQSFQSRIGYITQDPVIFDDTVYNNVTFWSKKTPDNLKRFEQALKQAHIYKFIEDSKDKEDLRLGNNGVSLSGGQKQRISIARELYKDVDFLFMDEATSALDTETERHIQDSLDTLKGQYTIIIIAHRLSTVKNCDRIVLMEKGQIKGIGDYYQLIKESSKFQQMIKHQQV